MKRDPTSDTKTKKAGLEFGVGQNLPEKAKKVPEEYSRVRLDKNRAFDKQGLPQRSWVFQQDNNKKH